MIHAKENGRTPAGERIFELSGETLLGRALVKDGVIVSVEIAEGENKGFYRDFLLRSVVFALVESEEEIRTTFVDELLLKLGFAEDGQGGMCAEAGRITFKGSCSAQDRDVV
ncbi:MAG: hypothetical protein LBH24_06730 [Clostridiales bacterium]|jgi:hypothetical protein|nr:hypothetical protein [Clostridiales bacterium]